MSSLVTTYSYTDVLAAISGPGGQFTLGGPDTAAAEEGITITWGEENNTQNIGADGSVMNSMHASRAGSVTFRYQLASPIRKPLSDLWTFQRQSSIFWGRNVITIEQVALQDVFNLSGCAFVRFATTTYPKIGTMQEWEFHVGVIDPRLGPGIFQLAA